MSSKCDINIAREESYSILGKNLRIVFIVKNWLRILIEVYESGDTAE